MHYHPARQGHVGAWYNSLSDLWGDIQAAAGRIPQARDAITRTAQNVANATTTGISLSGQTLLYGALGVAGALMAERLLRRRNPPRRYRRRRARR